MVEELKPEGQKITDQKSDETTVTISQEKLNSLISEKFKKGAEKANTTLLESLGVDNLDSLKEIVKAKAEADEASKTELQKLQDQLEAERNAKADLESRLNQTVTETEVQNIALSNGINPDKVKYFKMDYLEAKNKEGFDSEKFISELKEKQPDFFNAVGDVSTVNVGNPPNRRTPSTQIKMEDYVQLSAEERKKYKSTDLIR